MEPKFTVIATTATFAAANTMLRSGNVDCLRINASHATLDKIVSILTSIQTIIPNPPPVYVDLQGAKLRLSDFQPEVTIASREPVIITTPPKNNAPAPPAREEMPAHLYVDEHAFNVLVKAAPTKLTIDDAKVTLTDLHLHADKKLFTALVAEGGKITPRRGVNITPHPVHNTMLTPKDEAIVKKTRQFPFVRYALSFVSSPSEITHLKNLSVPPVAPGSSAVSRFVAAKIEIPLPDDVLMAVAKASDEVWLCRGDLGARLGLSRLAAYYLRFRALLPRLPCPAILAGEVLDHMVRFPTPTRSEACHLAEVMKGGFAGVVLSNETVLGEYPLLVPAVVKEVLRELIDAQELPANAKVQAKL